ncbi:DDE-type integrase/transposase/recombinase [Micromonospora sp. ATA51]|nr:DDE-type integrase/transposase/recombinase [Micromonospora sp. ATA51]
MHYLVGRRGTPGSGLRSDHPGEFTERRNDSELGLVSARRDGGAARRFFRRALSTLKVTPAEVVTDAAAIYPAVLDELIPSTWHHVEQYANNPIKADHSQLKQRLKPMHGLRTDKTAQVIIAGHAFMQNLRRGHYEIAIDAPPTKRAAAGGAAADSGPDSAPLAVAERPPRPWRSMLLMDAAEGMAGGMMVGWRQ